MSKKKIVVAVSGGFDPLYAGHIRVGGGKIQSSCWLSAQQERRAEFKREVKKLLNKKIIVFDLDGTLTESKSNLDQEMAQLLCSLLKKWQVAVISGGNLQQFQKQFLAFLPCDKRQLENLVILPTSGASFFKFQKNKWQLVYQNHLSQAEKTKILKAFKKAFLDINYIEPKKKYGPVIEDRQSQITFSALGQKAPLAEKENWNKTQDIRNKLKGALEKYLPEFEVRLGGLTSIDVTKKGIDKAYGVWQIMKIFSVTKKKVIYIGDALYQGGNDEAVLKAGIDAVQVSGPKETKCLIWQLLLRSY